jgi:hypothetical protein
MGTLTPGANYVYESDGTRIYAREFGQLERKVIGYTQGGEEREQRRYYMNQMNDILTMCEKDSAMKELLDQLFVLYNLKKQHE